MNDDDEAGTMAKHVKSAWVSSAPRPEKRPWGSELSWSALPNIHGKLIDIHKGNKTNLKYHLLKSEVLFVLTGRVEAEFGDERTLKDPIGHPWKKQELLPGQSLVVQSGSPYRITALEDSRLIEIGDRKTEPRTVRLEDDYGRG